MPATYQLFKDLPPAIESALRDSIDRFGVLVPVAKDQHGNVLDGHQRARIADSLGVKYPVNIIEVADEDEAREIARTLNEDRRAMPKEERLPVVQALREEGHSLRAIAGAVGVDVATVHRDLSGVAGATPPTSRGLDGKSYPARKVPKLPENDALQQAAAIKREQRAEREQARDAQAEACRVALPPVGDRWRIIHGSLSGDVPVDDASVDCIITDPPYPAEFLPLYDDLAEFAAAKLKPGGSLICMVGQSYLPAIITSLCARLTYHWTAAYLTPGGQAVQVWPRKVNTFWKPLLWFTSGEYAGDWAGDVCRSDVNDNDKRFHEWGQSVSGMADVVERFSRVGDLVCDPFCGAGTTGVAALALDRQFVGIDVDGAAVASALARLSESSEA